MEHFPKIPRYPILKGFQRFNVLGRKQGTGLCIHLGLSLLFPQADGPHIPPEHMESAPGQICSSKKFPGRIQDSGQIPGYKIQIPVIQAGGPAQKRHCILSRIFPDRLPQGVPER